ncbi:MAG: hydantoinase/oxoprolinase family protein [Thermodesulfobacteriota bacterium]
MAPEALRLGVDTGGTFTDFILLAGSDLRRFKVSSTPDDPSRAIIQGLRHFFPTEIPDHLEIIHGTTVGTNAFLERKGARTLLITTKGFEDVINIGRQNRSKLYDINLIRAAALCDEALILGVKERILADGSVYVPLEAQEVERIKQVVEKEQPEAIAICLLHSYANACHEELLGDQLSHLSIPVILSSDILPEFREYERLSTTLINAYLSPVMSSYISRLAGYMEGKSLSVQQSNGGVLPAKSIEKRAVHTILSGPAGGVKGAFYLARQQNLDKIITFDMGGTSTDVSLCHRKPSLTTEYSLDGYPVRVPVLDIHTVGAGGGSIARVDGGGLLHVGPESAGADPGPVCYGKGEKVTVTDANLFLGRLLAEQFLGGRMSLDQGRSNLAMADLAGKLGLSPTECALGIIRIVTAGMVKAVRTVSLEKGHDPADFTLFSYGGASGLHCCDLARELGVKKIIIPARAGILSAQGMLCTEPLLDRVKALFLCGGAVNYDSLKPHILELNKRVEGEMAAMGLTGSMGTESFVDLRYAGQSFEITVPFSQDFLAAFHTEHEFAFGYTLPDVQIECVAIRSAAKLLQDHTPFARSFTKVPARSADTKTSQFVTVEFDKGRQEIPIRLRSSLQGQKEHQGPCLIIDDYTTILVPDDCSFSLDYYGNIVIATNKIL